MNGGIPPEAQGPAPERPNRGCLVVLTLLLLGGVVVAAVFAFGTPGLASPFGTRFWRLLLAALLVLLGICGLLLSAVHYFWHRDPEAGSDHERRRWWWPFGGGH